MKKNTAIHVNCGAKILSTGQLFNNQTLPQQIIGLSVLRKKNGNCYWPIFRLTRSSWLFLFQNYV